MHLVDKTASTFTYLKTTKIVMCKSNLIICFLVIFIFLIPNKCFDKGGSQKLIKQALTTFAQNTVSGSPEMH